VNLLFVLLFVFYNGYQKRIEGQTIDSQYNGYQKRIGGQTIDSQCNGYQKRIGQTTQWPKEKGQTTIYKTL
jgi:hypothetical protein